MNTYDKFKLLGEIDVKFLAEAKTPVEKKPSFPRYVPALVVACLLLLAIFSIFPNSLVDKMANKEIPVYTFVGNYAQEYEGDSIMNYLSNDKNIFICFDKNMKTNEKIKIINRTVDTKQEKYCPGFYEALKLCEDHNLKDISVIRINETTLVLKTVRNNSEFLIPVYYEKNLPEEYREIKSYEQLPEPSDLVVALNSSQEYSYAGNEVILHTKEK